MSGTRRVFQLDQRSIVDGASIHPDVAIAHHGLRDIEPIGLPIHSRDLAAVMIGLDHIDEHLAIADQFDQRGASGVAIRLGFLGRVDVLQTHVDLAPLRRPNQKAVAIENPADRARKILLVRACSGRQQAHAGKAQPTFSERSKHRESRAPS
jgi:hypothetical protein